MDFAAINIWSWLIPVLAALVCGLAAYFLGRKSARAGIQSEMQYMKDANALLQAELEACTHKLASTRPAPGTAFVFDADAARAAFGRSIRQDDLTLIDGIGPKIAGLFHNFDIKTWQSLAGTPVSKCQEVLDSGGDRFKVHDPASWPLQARMAFEGKWKDLVRWQDEHNHGKL